jgi:biotin-(acetyl-CoA carboxylase) ligase
LSLIHWSVRRSTAGVRNSALKLALLGEPEGTVVAQKDTNAAIVEFSTILRPGPSSQVGLLRMVTAFCTSEGIRKDTGIITWIRWPDTVIAGSAVIATTDVVFEPRSDPGWAVLTARINNGAVKEGGATSLYDVLGTKVDDQLLMEKVLESLAWMYYGFSRGMHPHIMKRVRSMVETVGRRVEITRDGRSVEGIVKDVDDEGRLVVGLDSGRKSLRVEFGESFREL